MSDAEQHDAGGPALPADVSGKGGAARAAGGRGGTQPQAWRLTYAFDANGIRLVAQQRVATVTPPDDSDLTESGRAGYWIELRDAAGEALYRQVIPNPFRMTAEVHSPEPGRQPRHVPTVAPEGAFQVLVPDLPGAHEVVLHGLTGPGERTPGEPVPEARKAAEPKGPGAKAPEPKAPEAKAPEAKAARPRRGGRREPERAAARPILTERLSETPPFEVS